MMARSRAAYSAAPPALCSVNEAKPMPISLPSGSPRFWRTRTAGDIEQLGAQTDSGGIVAPVVMHPADREVRHLFGPDHIFGTYLDRVAPDRPRDLVDGSLDRKTCARAADPAIGAEWRLVGRHR